MKPINEWTREELQKELTRYQELAALTLPRKEEFPNLPNIDYFGTVDPYQGCVGGDYLAVIDFNRYGLKQKIRSAKKADNTALSDALTKNLDSFGIAVADVSGHGIAESSIVTYLNAVFRTLLRKEIEQHGEVTTGFVKELNHEVYKYTRSDFLIKEPHISFLYGEIHNDGRFRYVTAGHPAPIIFSNEFEKLQKLDESRTLASTPLGIFPSRFHLDADHFEMVAKGHHVDKIDVNELHLLMPGDIMFLYTDALTEQRGGELNFAETRMEDVLRAVKDEPARAIHDAVKRELFAFVPREDDLTLVVIKKK